MARIDVGGIGIEYALLGEPGAPAVAITPGGRFSKDVGGIRELGEAMVARGWRVLLWDRPNCGASDMCFEGDGESRMQARTLVGLIRALDLGPTALAAGSAGSRVSLLAAAEDPAAISHLCLWWVSGGICSLMMLAGTYCCEQAVVASSKGMEAVAAMPGFAEQVSRNPRNRDIIAGQDRARFIATMERWAANYIPSDVSPVPGMRPEDYARLTMPVLIFRGSPTDLFHPAATSDWLAELIPHAELVEPPWPHNLFDQRLDESFVTGGSLFSDWPMLAPMIGDFLERPNESGDRAPSAGPAG